MKTTPPTRKEDVKDPVGITGWPKEKGRDGERTPMQWDASANAGFTKAANAVAAGSAERCRTINVKAEKSDPNSLLAWYRSLIHLKKTVPAFEQRRQRDAGHGNTKVLSWMRKRRVPAGGGERELHSRSADGESGDRRRGLGKVKTLLKTPGGGLIPEDGVGGQLITEGPIWDVT